MNAPLSPQARNAGPLDDAASSPLAGQAGGGAPAPMLQLQLSLDDVNLLLEAVGALPFARVYGLVGRIQAQAAAQLQAQAQMQTQVQTQARQG